MTGRGFGEEKVEQGLVKVFHESTQREKTDIKMERRKDGKHGRKTRDEG